MRRLPRILLNAATVVSIVLFVATVVLFIRSVNHEDVLGYVWRQRQPGIGRSISVAWAGGFAAPSVAPFPGSTAEGPPTVVGPAAAGPRTP